MPLPRFPFKTGKPRETENRDTIAEPEAGLLIQQERENPGSLRKTTLDLLFRQRPMDVAKVAAQRLDNHQLQSVCDRFPAAAIEHLANTLNDAQIRQCLKSHPAMTIIHAGHRLDRETLASTANACGRKIIAIIGNQPRHPVVDLLNGVADQLGTKLRNSVAKAIRKRNEPDRPKARQVVFKKNPKKNRNRRAPFLSIDKQEEREIKNP